MFRNWRLTSVELEELFAKAPNAYVILDRDFVIRGMNDAYLATTARTREDLLGKNMFDAFPSDPASTPGRMLRGSLNKVLGSRATDHLPLIPYPIANPKGDMEERYWSATHVPILKEGEVAFILQNTADVTELQRLRQLAGPDLRIQSDILGRAGAVSDLNIKLAEEQGFLRNLFEQAPGFTAVLRGPNHVFDLANAAYRKLVGSERTLVGMTVADALPEVVGQGFVEILDEVYRSGRPFMARGASISLRSNPDEEPQEYILDFIYQPIVDGAGKPIGIFVQGNDITDRVRAEAAARLSESNFSSLAQSVPNHAWAVDANGALEWCNDRVYDYTGLTPADLVGNQLGTTIHPDDQDRVRFVWRQCRETGETLEVQVRLRRHDGSYRWHLTRAVPARDTAGKVLRWIGTNTDIDEQKKNEEQLAYLAQVLEDRVEERTIELEKTQEVLRQSQKMEAIGNLAGGIAHDFNNLLQVVTGNLQLLTKFVSGNARATSHIDNALNAALKGASLASQLLAFGRRQPLEPRVVNLGRLVRDMDNLLRRSLGEAIEIDTIVSGGLWNTLVDPTNVETALLNLAINARDAMNGSGKLTIELGNAYLDDDYARSAAEVVPGQYVMLAVTDTGSGIPPHILEKVFEPFFTTKPEGRGTGLGLSMVYGFVKQSKGHVKIYSEVGSGTTIRIYLPRSKEAEDVLTAVAHPSSGGSETVLVVEDDEAVRETAVALLTDLGYRVLKARDAASGLGVIESGVAIDLLFTDVVMPGPMKSTDLARKAKERLPNIAVLFTSGYTENSIVHDGRLDDGVQFLSKPYTRDKLARKLRQVLEDASGNSVAAPTPSTPRPPEDPAVAPAADAPGPVAQAPQMAEKPAAGALCVLLCEDEPLIRMATAEHLEDAGMIVLEAGSVSESLSQLSRRRPDILVADVNLPDGSGIDLARQMRERVGMVPVLFATGAHQDEKAIGLEQSEFLLKPYDMEQLLVRIRHLCGV